MERQQPAADGGAAEEERLEDLISPATAEETVRRAMQPERGRLAARPRDIPLAGFKDIAWRVWGEIQRDRVMLTAGGATFYLLLALFPALAAFVSIYGFIADPQTIAEHISFLGGLLPSGGMDIIERQLDALISQNRNALSFGFIFGLALTLWSANVGIKTLFEAMNIAYGERERRSFLKLNAISFAFTLGAMAIACIFLLSVGVVPAVLAFLALEHMTEMLISLSRWPVLLVAIWCGIMLIYRFGPSRRHASWHWLGYGAALATLVWIAASMGFSFYLQNFADYNATYGSLGAVVGFMMWVWISSMILIVGAELNAELEHQTAHDTTIGEARPLGERRAVMADTLGETRAAPGGAGTGPARPEQEPDDARALQIYAAAALGAVLGWVLFRR